MGDKSGILLSFGVQNQQNARMGERENTGMDNARLVQEVQAQQNHKQALLQDVLVQSIVGEKIPEGRVRETEGSEDHAPMRAMRSRDLKGVQSRPQTLLAGVLGVDGLDALGDGHLVGGVFSRDTYL